MIEFNKSYFLKQREEIILNFNKLKNIFKNQISKNEELRTSNYSKYETLLSYTKDWNIPEKFNLEEILNFYVEAYKIYNIFSNLPKLINTNGQSGEENTNFISVDLVKDFLSYFEFLLPTLEDYKLVFLKSGELNPDPSKKLSKILIEKKLYNFIVHFKLEIISSELRKQIEIYPTRKKNYEILFRIQRFGFVPISNFEKQKPEQYASIIKLDYTNPIVYNFTCLKRIYQKNEGISKDYVKNVVQPYQIDCPYTPPKLTINKSNIIYETFDNIHFRKLYGSMKKYERGPSAIALGYNTLFNNEFENKIKKPFATTDELTHVQTKNRLKFDTIIVRLENLILNYTEIEKEEKKIEIKKKISLELREFLTSSLKFTNINSFLKREINIGLELEMTRFNTKLERSSFENFIDFLRSLKSNLINKAEQKIKIYSKLNIHFTS